MNFQPRDYQQIWVELKAPGKSAEPHQLREHNRMWKYGMRWIGRRIGETTQAAKGRP